MTKHFCIAFELYWTLWVLYRLATIKSQTQGHVLLKLLFLGPFKHSFNQNVINFKNANVISLPFRLFFTSQNSTCWFINSCFLAEREQDKQLKLKGSYCSLAMFLAYSFVHNFEFQNLTRDCIHERCKYH